MSDAEDDDVDLASVASEEEDVAPDVDGDKWVLFNNGSESTAWLQVLYGLGFANSLDYNKHDFYFVQYQRVDGGAPKFVLFGVKRKEDEFAQIDSVAEVDVTSALLQSLQRSEYFMLNLSDEAQICINVLLSAFNMRPNDMNRNTTQLILRLRRKIQTHIKDCFYEKMLSEVAYKMEDGDNYEESNFETEDKDTIEYYEGYVRVHLSVDRLCKRMQALVIADKKTADEIEKSELAEAERKLESERAETTRLTRELEVKNSENTSLKSTNETLSKENEKIARLETTVASLQSEKTEIEKAKNVLESNVSNLEAQNFGLRLKLTSRPADVSGEETGGEDAVGGAAGAGETGRTGAEDPAKASAGGGETGRTEAESHRKATEDASAENKRVDSEAKEATAKRKADAEAAEQRAEREREVKEGAAEGNNDKAKESQNKFINYLETTISTPITDEVTIGKKKREMVKDIEKYLFQNDETIPDIKPLKSVIDTFNQLSNSDNDKYSDAYIVNLKDINKVSIEKIVSGLYLLLNRLKTYPNFLDSQSKENINQIQFKTKEDIENEENKFVIFTPKTDTEGATEERKRVLWDMVYFCTLYGPKKYSYENFAENIQNKNKEISEYNRLIAGLTKEINNSSGKDTVVEFIDHIFNLKMKEALQSEEKMTEFIEKLKIDSSALTPDKKVVSSRSDAVMNTNTSYNSHAYNTARVCPSHAVYTPMSAYDTATQHTIQPVFMPVTTPQMHFSSGLMY